MQESVSVMLFHQNIVAAAEKGEQHFADVAGRGGADFEPTHFRSYGTSTPGNSDL